MPNSMQSFVRDIHFSNEKIFLQDFLKHSLKNYRKILKKIISRYYMHSDTYVWHVQISNHTLVCYPLSNYALFNYTQGNVFIRSSSICNSTFTEGHWGSFYVTGFVVQKTTSFVVLSFHWSILVWRNDP